MLNLGNGAYSGARCYQHLVALMKAFEELGGLQQCGLGPDPMPKEEYLRLCDIYDSNTMTMLEALAKDLGFKITNMHKEENK
jgi:hypothetical protein